MTINELIKKLNLPLNTWDVPVLIDGKEIDQVNLVGSYEKQDYHVEIKSKK